MTGFDPVRIIEVLARHGVDFVVIGGFAAELYRVPVPPTTDIDVTPSMAAPNMARLSAALYELGARIRTAEVPEGLPFSHDASSLARAGVWNLTTTAGNFDVTFRPSGTEATRTSSSTRWWSTSGPTRWQWPRWPMSCAPRRRPAGPRTSPSWPSCVAACRR